jgi:HlyD family secretion protein
MSNKQELNNLAVDFQPDAVEIAMRPLPFGAKLGIWIGIIFFFGSLIASYFCEVDVIVNGTGKLVSVEPNIVMKPLDRTVIKSVNVKVGEVVREGQVLMTFDPELNQADEERLESDYQSYKAQFDRWNAEFNNTEYKLSAKPTPSEERQLALFRQRRKYYAEKLRYFSESIERVQVNVQASREVVTKQRERMKVMRLVVVMHEDLLKSKAGTQLDLLEYRMALTQL